MPQYGPKFRIETRYCKDCQFIEEKRGQYSCAPLDTTSRRDFVTGRMVTTKTRQRRMS